MSYPRFNAPLRTDEDFRNRKDPDHHQVDGLTRLFVSSPLERLPINMVENFVICDDLHFAYLGIMKRKLNGWKNGGYNFSNYKLSPDKQIELSNKLKKCNEFKPCELHRAARGIDCLAFWKGLEFRTFLLYLGSVVLRDIFFDKNLYDHFMLLSCAITICSCKTYIDEGLLPLAEALIDTYLELYIHIYQIDSINNNLHN